MSFCNFSKEYNTSAFTSVENIFIRAYLPEANEKAVKIYLYGLYLCQSGEDYSVKDMSASLKTDEQEIIDCYKYWEEYGLVDIISDEPFMVTYQPIGLSGAKPRKVNIEKYTEFNNLLQKIITGRMISPHEYQEYFQLMETFSIQQEAMLMIAQYCVDIKGNSIGYKYISTVAKEFASQGITTPEKVEKRLADYIIRSSEITKILTALSQKRKPEIDDVKLFAKWTGELGFEMPSILQAASNIKRGSMQKLDELMMELYANKAFGVEEIAQFGKSRKYLYELAVKINKQLSYYCEILDPEVTSYVSPWIAKGFHEDALLFIANYCFRHGKRDLQQMDDIIVKLYANGIIDIDSIGDYFTGISEDNKFLRSLLENVGQTRKPNDWDRQNLRQWRSWGFTDEMISYAASVAAGKNNPTVYMNAVLGSWKTNEIFNIQDAKNSQKAPYFPQKQTGVHFKNERKYTQEQLDAIITDVDDIEI